MKISTFKIGKTGDAHAVDPKTCLERRDQDDGVYWIDIEGAEPDELSDWLKPLDLSPLALKFCREAGDITRFAPLADALFFEFAVFTEGTELGRMPVSVLCVGNLLLRLHPEPLESNPLHSVTLRELGLEPTVDALVTLLLTVQLSRVRLAVQAVTRRVGAIDDRLDHDPDQVSTEEIVEQKDALRVLDAVSSEQATCYQLLASLDSNVPALDQRNGLRQVVAAGAQHNRRSVERLQAYLADQWQRFDMHKQDKTNSRLAALTVISAIFLPLTLFAGIWGMNFAAMPELQWPHGYAVALGFMALVAAGLSWFFYKRGWFG